MKILFVEWANIYLIKIAKWLESTRVRVLFGVMLQRGDVWEGRECVLFTIESNIWNQLSLLPRILSFYPQK